MTDQLTPEKILQTGFAFWPAKTLLSAIEMGVFTELARGAESHDALAAGSACMRDRRATFSTRSSPWGF